MGYWWWGVTYTSVTSSRASASTSSPSASTGTATGSSPANRKAAQAGDTLPPARRHPPPDDVAALATSLRYAPEPWPSWLSRGPDVRLHPHVPALPGGADAAFTLLQVCLRPRIAEGFWARYGFSTFAVSEGRPWMARLAPA